MNLKYIDIHSHLNLKPLSENTEAVLAKMRTEGIGTITVGTGIKTSQEAIRIAENNPGLCWATVGIHPTDGDEVFVVDEFLKLAQHPCVVAIGETGLDYAFFVRKWSERTQKKISSKAESGGGSETLETFTEDLKHKQVELFKKHIELAMHVGKPLMLHVRASNGTDDAYYDALQILNLYQPSLLPASNQRGEEGEGRAASPGGVSALENTQIQHTSALTGTSSSRGGKFRANFHFFSGSKQCMLDIVSAGYTISVDGPITFTDQYDDMIRACPIESIMCETDAPFAAPMPYRGKICEPWMVIEVAKKIADIKELDQELVRKQLLKNTQDFFGI